MTISDVINKKSIRLVNSVNINLSNTNSYAFARTRRIENSFINEHKYDSYSSELGDEFDRNIF